MGRPAAVPPQQPLPRADFPGQGEHAEPAPGPLRWTPRWGGREPGPSAAAGVRARGAMEGAPSLAARPRCRGRCPSACDLRAGRPRRRGLARPTLAARAAAADDDRACPAGRWRAARGRGLPAPGAISPLPGGWHSWALPERELGSPAAERRRGGLGISPPPRRQRPVGFGLTRRFGELPAAEKAPGSPAPGFAKGPTRDGIEEAGIPAARGQRGGLGISPPPRRKCPVGPALTRRSGELPAAAQAPGMPEPQMGAGASAVAVGTARGCRATGGRLGASLPGSWRSGWARLPAPARLPTPASAPSASPRAASASPAAQWLCRVPRSGVATTRGPAAAPARPPAPTGSARWPSAAPAPRSPPALEARATAMLRKPPARSAPSSRRSSGWTSTLLCRPHPSMPASASASEL